MILFIYSLSGVYRGTFKISDKLLEVSVGSIVDI